MTGLDSDQASSSHRLLVESEGRGVAVRRNRVRRRRRGAGGSVIIVVVRLVNSSWLAGLCR
jgi:hypothetical protein